MKKWIAILLVFLVSFSLTACELPESSNEAGKEDCKYVYDENGNVIREERYANSAGSDYNELTMVIEFSYNENNLLQEKIWHHESTGKTQRGVFSYDAFDRLLEVKLYNHEDEHICTATYTRDEKGTIISKEAVFLQLKKSSVAEMDGDGNSTWKTVWALPDFFDDMNRTSSVFVEEEWFGEALTVDANTNIIIHVDYYASGLEKQIIKYFSGRMYERTEYSDNEMFQNAVLEDCAKNKLVQRDLTYQAVGDGTYVTSGIAGTKTYIYDVYGNLSGYIEYNENADAISEEYYPSGALKSHCEAKCHPDYMMWESFFREVYYESGALQMREEESYPKEGMAYDKYTCEEFYENGAKRSLKEYDQLQGINTYTEWDEEGNEIPSTGE